MDWLYVRYYPDVDRDPVSRADVLGHCLEQLDCGPYYVRDGTPEYRYHAGDQVHHTADPQEMIDAAVDEETGFVGLSYGDVPFSLVFEAATSDRLGLPSMGIGVDDAYLKPFRDNDPGVVRDLLVALYDELSPRYVYGDVYLDESNVSREGVEQGRMEGLFWVNGFGPGMAESVGRDRLLESPAWCVEELDDGGIFVWLSPSAWTTREYVKDIEAAEAYFGMERGSK